MSCASPSGVQKPLLLLTVDRASRRSSSVDAVRLLGLFHSVLVACTATAVLLAGRATEWRAETACGLLAIALLAIGTRVHSCRIVKLEWC